MSELGIAAFIASVIGIVVEFSLRKQEDEEHKRKLDAIQKDVFRHLFGKQVDEVISDQIMDMMKGQQMRQNLTLSYYFRAADPTLKKEYEAEEGSTSDLLYTELTVSYILANRSSSDIDVEIKHYFETLLPTPENKSCGFTSFAVYEGETKVIDHDMKSGDQRIVKCESEDRGFRHGVKIDRGHLKLDPRKPVQVTYIYATLRRWRDSETWLSSHPADGMSIEVKVDSTVADKIEFYIDSSHAEAPKLVSGPSHHNYRWVLSQGVLPGHGILLCWKPKRSVSGGIGSVECNKYPKEVVG